MYCVVCTTAYRIVLSVPYTLVYLEFFLSNTAFTKIVCETDFFGLFLVMLTSVMLFPVESLLSCLPVIVFILFLACGGMLESNFEMVSWMLDVLVLPILSSVL